MPLLVERDGTIMSWELEISTTLCVTDEKCVVTAVTFDVGSTEEGMALGCVATFTGGGLCLTVDDLHYLIVVLTVAE